MSVNSTDAFSGPYIATGAAQEFPFTFIAASRDEVQVTADGLIVSPISYTVDLEDDGTGTVSATILTGSEVFVESNPNFDQSTQFSRFAPYFPDAINVHLDRAAIRDIALQDRIDRTFVIPRRYQDAAGKFARIGAGGQWELVDGVPGIAGPAAAFRGNLTILKAAATTDGVSQYDGSLWTWTLGNYTGQADDVNIVKANSTALTVGAWVRQKADKVTAKSAGTGAISRDVETVLRDMPVNPLQFGAVGNGVANDTTAVRAAIAYALSSKKPLDLTTGTAGWKINGELDFTGLQMLYASFDKPINVDVTGSFPRSSAVLFGDPAQTAFNGRSNALQIIGNLTVNASARATSLIGVYVKGSFMNVGAIRVSSFGTGINIDSVWDSVFGRLSVELCGSATSYALVLDSNGDTTNATHISSIQCEQAYQRGIKANLLRYKIDNIHSERLAITSAGDVNHSFLLSNSSIDQAVLHCLTTGTAPDGTALAATSLRIRMVGDLCAFNEIDAEGATIFTDFGTQIAMRNIICANWTQTSPSTRIEAHLMRITGNCSVERDTTLTESDINTFLPLTNARNIILDGGKITAPLNFTSNISGNITMNEVSLNGVQDTRGPSAGFLPLTLNNCTSPTFVGSFNGKARINGGSMGAVSLVSRSLVDFRGTDFTSFTYAGDSGFLTRECTCSGSATWTVPLSVAYPAGTVTERVGYNAAGKIYQNTDGANTWVAL